jgi:hypothetical protein
LHVFPEDSSGLFIGRVGCVPRLQEEGAALIRISVPNTVGDAAERACAQLLIAKIARIIRQRYQQGERESSLLFSFSLGRSGKLLRLRRRRFDGSGCRWLLYGFFGCLLGTKAGSGEKYGNKQSQEGHP